MSFPTAFTNTNCDISIANETVGGAMPNFCQPFASDVPHSTDACYIKDQDAYNEYQLDCVNRRHGKFIDNNNNTVWVESTPEYTGTLKEPVKFPFGSHDNMHFVPVSHHEFSSSDFVGKEHCQEVHDVTTTEVHEVTITEVHEVTSTHLIVYYLDADDPHYPDPYYSSAKPTHTVTVTKCLVALLSMNFFLMTTNLF